MDISQLEALLYEGESHTLDFKQDDYGFPTAAIEKKAAYLIDMLALANAWRTSTAHLVLGVSDKRDVAPRIVTGIKGGILERNLQQLVNGKTNLPLLFSYEEVQIKGKTVGVFALPVQQRPIYLRSDFAHAKANTVYVRRGDTNAIASPDETIRMAANPISLESQPHLLVDLADIEQHEITQTASKLSSKSLDIGKERIPSYSTAGPLGIRTTFSENTNYYRDAFEFCYDAFYYSPIGFAVTNKSGLLAKNVKLRMWIVDDDVTAKSKSDMAGEPSRTVNPIAKLLNLSARNGIHVEARGQKVEVLVELGDIQPGTTEFMEEPIFFGSRTTKDFTLEVIVSADNLTSPKQNSFELAFQSETLQIDREKFLDHYDERT